MTARQSPIAHSLFLEEAASNIGKTSKYVHITGTVTSSSSTTAAAADPLQRIDCLLEPVVVPLDERTCPIPRNTPYIAIDRSHYVKDDKTLRYIPMSSAADSVDPEADALNAALYGNDSDTEFEEQEDVLLDFLYEHLSLNDEDTVSRIERVFYLHFDRIQHRITARSHRKSKILKQQKQTLSVHGHDTKNRDVPIDSFSLLFCPRCTTYDCSLHGLDAPRRRNRALPSDAELRDNVDYFGTIHGERGRGGVDGVDRPDPNALAHRAGNHSANNHMVDGLLPPSYTPSTVYPLDLSECRPCSDDCYIRYIRMGGDGVNEDDEEREWDFMDTANLRRLLNICKLHFCQIAAILGHVSCHRVYLKALELMPSLRPYVSSKTASTSTSKVPPRKRAPAAPKEAASDLATAPPLEVGAENAPRQFFGCNHGGACTAANDCSCSVNQVHCEKFCCCDGSCCRRFAGCSCADGRCRSSECPCFRAHRECDPDRCSQCQAFLPREVVDAAIEWLRVNAPEYHRKRYQCKFMEKGSTSSAPAKTQSHGEDESESETKRQWAADGDGGGVRVKLLGIDGVDPFRLCGNTGCTQRRNKRLWIGKSRVHGFGCFVAEPILKDEFITEYLGEMISQNEADRRGRVYDEQNISYLFNLNEEYVVDATRKGAKIKFANHSTNPNCRAKIVTVNGDHRICFYANKHFKVGEELLFDYRHEHHDNAKRPQWFNKAT